VQPYASGSAHVPAVDQQLAACDEFILEVRDRLEQAQQLYKEAYDKNHRDLVFAVGDWVWLRLLHRPIASLSTHGRGKLGPRFQIKERVGDVTYKLNLLASARLHDVFHVGLLKPHKGAAPLAPGALPPTLHGRACPQPAEVIKGRLARGIQELLVRWEGQNAANATWVDLPTFQAQFPSFQLEDALVVNGGRVVMTGLKY
jgi:hypothetical protein